MPVHEWFRVEPDIFHSFHHSWIADISRALNGGLLPSEYYALKERFTGKPATLTLERLPDGVSVVEEPIGGIDLLMNPPRVRAQTDYYATKWTGGHVRGTSRSVVPLRRTNGGRCSEKCCVRKSKCC